MSDAASVIRSPLQQTHIQRPGKQAASMQQNSSGHHQQQQQQQQQAGRGQQVGALPSVPEHAVLGSATGDGPVQLLEPRKVLKKKRKKKAKRRSRPTQLGGMTDVEKSRWMLEHCKVGCSSAGPCSSCKSMFATLCHTCIEQSMTSVNAHRHNMLCTSHLLVHWWSIAVQRLLLLTSWLHVAFCMM